MIPVLPSRGAPCSSLHYKVPSNTMAPKKIHFIWKNVDLERKHVDLTQTSGKVENYEFN